jgi:hypothetical protein
MFTPHSRGLWLRLLLSSLTAIAVEAQTNVPSEPNTTTAADSVITINEIMYHPVGDEPAMEWVELYNQMSVNVDISGWTVRGGIDFQFPTNTVFPASSYIVVAANPEQLRSMNGLTNVYGPFTNRLSNGGETLRLRNQSRRLMDEITYADEDPWPVGADGSGASLAKRDRYYASSPAANWKASVQPGGTPGRANVEETATAGPMAVPLITASSASRWFVPPGDFSSSSWASLGYNDSQWSIGKSALGYDTALTGPVELSNVALRKPVIDGSGAYANNRFDVADAAGNFTAGKVTDGSTADGFGQNYWLGRQGVTGEYFTVDLGRSFAIEEIRLRNTHNSQYNDRGTANFEIWAAQSIEGSQQLVSPIRVLTGKLSDVTALATIPADVFTAENGLIPTDARYVKFVALTANNIGNNVGLNEIEIYAGALSGPDRSYSFDGNVTDGSGSGINGVNLGAQFSTNITSAFTTGQSIQFDGITNQVRIPDPINPGAYTIAMWVSADAVQSSSILLRTDSSGPKTSWSHQLRINGSGQFEHFIFDGSGRSVAATNIIEPGRWYHVTITAVSNRDIRIFVNGVPSGGARVIGGLSNTGTQWVLGSDAGNAANFFKGRIDQLFVWHSELDNQAISALAAGQLPARLGGYHRFFNSDVEDALFNKSSSLLVRIPFQILNSAPLEQLTLRARYADGFVAFLNGTEVLRRNAPLVLNWNSAALTNRQDAEVATFETVDLSAFAPILARGENVLAVHALNSSVSDPAFLFSAELSAQPVQFSPITNLVFTEIASAENPAFFVELQNTGDTGIALSGCTILSSAGPKHTFTTNMIGSDSRLTLSVSQLGFPVKDGDRLFLIGRTGDLIDAVEVHNRSRSRLTPAPDAPWFYSSSETPGDPNSVSFTREIVINEIMYHHAPRYRNAQTAFAENDEQWIELYNVSDRAVDLSGWRLDGEITFRFPAGTAIGPDSYLVVAKDRAALTAKYPA